VSARTLSDSRRAASAATQPESKYAVRVSRSGSAPPRAWPQRAERAEDQIGHGLPVPGEHGVDEEVGGAQHGAVELQAVGQVEGVQGLLVRLDDPAGPRLGAADGDASAVGGRVRLFGEEVEYVVLVAGRDAHQTSVLGGHEDAAVAEPADQGALHIAGHGVPLVVRRLAPRHRDGVGVRQAQPEAFGALGQQAQVAAAVQEVVDELPACGLLLAYGEELRALVALGEGVDGLLDGGERALAGRGRPVDAGGGQVRADQGAQSVPRLGGPLAQGPAGGEFLAGQPAAGRGGVREDAPVPVQVLLGYLPPRRHARPRFPDEPLTSF
jgi:hypothetical protein